MQKAPVLSKISGSGAWLLTAVAPTNTMITARASPTLLLKLQFFTPTPIPLPGILFVYPKYQETGAGFGNFRYSFTTLFTTLQALETL